MSTRALRTAGVAATAAAMALTAVVLSGASHGHPTETVRLLSGAAWLPSTQVGQVTLLDGTSAEVAAQVQVAPRLAPIDVVQRGSTAYAVDRSAGTIRRVDGATFETGEPAAPIAGAGSALTAFAGPDTVFALDTQRGVLARTDPNTLLPQGEPLSLAARPSPGAAAIDENGTLWVLDPATGDLTSFRGSTRTAHRSLTRPGAAVLTFTGGQPVIVNLADRKATLVDGQTGLAHAAVDLDLRAEDTVLASGSPHARRLYLVSSRGVLAICDLGGLTCDNAIPLGSPETRFGAAVEAGNRVFVPDFTGGRVWIIDLGSRAVLARPQVLPPGQFQLLARDGVVFFNDPNSERAGVIRLDGEVRQTAKYDPSDPGKGLRQPGTDGPPQSSQPPQPTQTPQPSQPSQAPPASQQPPRTPTPPPPTTTTPPAQAPTLRIVLSTVSPETQQDVSLRVETTTGALPSSAHWDFNDGRQGDGVTVTHQWYQPRTYQVSVQATMPDGTRATTSLSIAVSQKVTLTVNATTGGTVTGGGIACPPTCIAKTDTGASVVLTAHPNPGNDFNYWGAGCSTTGGPPTAPTCTVIMNADTSLAVGFAPSRIRFTLSVPGGHGTITANGVACPPTCTTSYGPGENVALAAVPDPGYLFGKWTGGCPTPTAAQCTVQATANRTISATFGKPKVTLTVVISGSGTVTGGPVSCAPTCVVQVDQGSSVLLTGNPAPNFIMAFWSDVCVDPPFQKTCTMLMDKDKSVTANFRQTG